MSVFIKNMRIPTSCSVCAFCGYYGKGDHVCDITGKEVVYELSFEKRLDDCPLIELPPHGRLIDADSLKETLDYYIREAGWSDEINEALTWVRDEFIDHEPTIIEAEEVSE